MSAILSSDYKSNKEWFEFFIEISNNGTIQYFIQKLIEETEQELLNINPGVDPIGYHNLATKVFARLELLNQQLEFFNKIKEEFEAQLKEG